MTKMTYDQCLTYAVKFIPINNISAYICCRNEVELMVFYDKHLTRDEVRATADSAATLLHFTGHDAGSVFISRFDMDVRPTTPEVVHRILLELSALEALVA
ncbi:MULTISPECIES: hypothetical protein [unclassified Adlercreutzia]|uniref:hypothetical protein n=1 Tax=unclassified Adlercreutzia TaxID=2636013 RepID=UPI0013EAEE3A|nr:MULTISPECIES: hypothetical protein [unclassified Adlercreutzia]